MSNQQEPIEKVMERIKHQINQVKIHYGGKFEQESSPQERQNVHDVERLLSHIASLEADRRKQDAAIELANCVDAAVSEGMVSEFYDNQYKTEIYNRRVVLALERWQRIKRGELTIVLLSEEIC